MSYKPKIKAKERTAIRSARDAYNTFLSKWNTDLPEYQEEFKVMLLNNHNKVLGIFDMAKGGTSGVLVD